MPAPTTVDHFLDLVRKSELLPEERLDAFLATNSAASPKQVAARLVTAGMLTQFQAEQLLLGKYRGFTIGKYKVLERIGYGGNGTVYLCEHLVVRRKVAIKVLPTNKADSPTALTRFYREARAAGALDHPHLVKAHDIDQDNGLHFLVMDYVDGTSLQDLVTRCGPLAPSRAAHYVAQAALGLQAAHDAGLVHRDVKPGNIMLDRRGVVRLSDLGLARFFCDGDDPLTLRFDEKSVLGTADYVAPEQALNSHEVDGRADIYSLGATFYFLLTGQPPFPGGKAAQKLIAHQVKEPTPVRQLRPEVPEDLAAVVARMLAKKREERFQTPLELVETLAPWTATPVPPPASSEMPVLSLAARGPASDDLDPASSTVQRAGRATRLQVAAGPSVPQFAWDSSSSGLPATPPRFDARPPSTPDPAARRTIIEACTRPDASLSVPALPPEPSVAPASVFSPSPRSSETDLARRRAQAVRLGVLLLLGLAGGAVLKWTVSRPVAAPPVPPPTLTVSRDGSSGTYPTLGAALQHAMPGARIVVVAETWEEALTVPAQPAVPVSIEGKSPSGGQVRWRAPHGHPAEQPLLRINGRAGLHLSGLVLDGEERLQSLVVLAGPCPDLVLDGVELKGFRQAGVVLRNCSGSTDRPVRLVRLRLTAQRTAAAALAYEARADEVNEHITVSDCRLEGPYQAAVVFDGPTNDVRFTQNRIYNAADAFLYKKASPTHPLRLALTHNTVCEVEKVGLHLEALPPTERSRIELTGNLFCRTAVLARVDDFVPQPVQTQAQWTWSADAGPADAGQRRHFRKTFSIAGASVVQGVLNIAGDSAFTVWLNGERIGHGELQSLTTAGHAAFRTSSRRVRSFNVGPYLRPGTNVLAVEGTTLAGPGGLLVQLTYTCAGTAPVTVVSDATWKTAVDAPPTWLDAVFNDGSWPAARVVAPYGSGGPDWQDLVWDAVVQDHFQGKAARLFPEPSGNVCDWKGREGFPLFKAVATPFELPTDTTDDGRFLRYPATSILMQAGSPGVPPAEVR